MRNPTTTGQPEIGVLEAVRHLEDLHARVSMNALTEEDRAAMQRKVCRMIEWVSQQSNHDIDRAIRKLVSAHDRLAKA